MDVEAILYEIGLNPKRDKDGWRMPRAHKDGDNPTALWVGKDGGWFDFVEGRGGRLESLIKEVLKLDKKEEVNNWLLNKQITLTYSPPKPRIKMQKTYPIEILNELSPIHNYWLNRGISLDVLREFKGGLAGEAGKLKKRYVFPIFNSKKEIVGFTGRDITNESNIKWKKINNSSEWVYPAFLNIKDILKLKEVILVESIGDLLSLWECGIKTGLCLFGVECSWALVNFFLKCDLERIVISTNNDSLNGGKAGNEAVEKITGRLYKYFDKKQIMVLLPKQAKDWNQILQLPNGRQIIKEWYNENVND